MELLASGVSGRFLCQVGPATDQLAGGICPAVAPGPALAAPVEVAQQALDAGLAR